MITLTTEAIAQVKLFLGKEVGLRIGVVGGGCSGLSYKMVMVTPADINPEWNEYDFDGLKVYIDQMSLMYLDGVTIDWISLMQDGASGFKFTNPNVKSTCGCGSSFSA
jgi:iron-sulfur cluster assembly protein